MRADKTALFYSNVERNFYCYKIFAGGEGVRRRRVLGLTIESLVNTSNWTSVLEYFVSQVILIPRGCVFDAFWLSGGLRGGPEGGALSAALFDSVNKRD